MITITPNQIESKPRAVTTGKTMSERSFKKEVQQLKMPAGEEFHGEGILAITEALMKS
jgi:hypothetical protein